MNLDALREAVPAYAKDLSLNLGTLAGETTLNAQQLQGTFLASAYAVGTPQVIRAIEAAADALTPEAKNAALLSAVFGGRIGSAAKAAATEEGKERLDKAFRLLEACAKHDEYAMAALLSAYEKDKPAALALFAFASAVFSAAMRGALQSDIAPSAAAVALPHFNKASTRLASNVSTKLVLAMLAADLAA